MKQIEISGANRLPEAKRERVACRCILLEEGRLLMSVLKKRDLMLTPGGGKEPGETDEECVIRETEEETGVLVRPLRPLVTVTEYYEDVRYVTHYFLCERTGRGAQRLTPGEIRWQLEPEMLPLGDVLALFSHHADFAADEEKRGCYLREYEALKGAVEELKRLNRSC